MAAKPGLNKNNSAVKRIMQEARELATDPSTDYSAAPLEDDIFEWHCTLRGPPGTEFEGGLYHFRIILPSEYPFRPPSIMMLTPNGRFELNTKICISFTNYHEELWQPAWGVRTAIIGLQGFFPLKGTAAVGVGALEYPAAERKRLATLSREWVCPKCNQSNLECLPDPPTTASSSGDTLCETSSSQPSEVSVTAAPLNGDAQIGELPAGELLSGPPEPELPHVDAPIISHSIPLIAPTPTRPMRPSIIPNGELPMEPAKSRVSEDAPARERAVPPAPVRPENFQPTLVAAALRQSPRRPPVLLDTAICVLLVLLCALVYRRVM